MDRDPAAWQEKLRDAPLESKADVCEQALKVWPGAVEVWLLYVKHASDPGAVLARCLPDAVDPRLFEAYIEHIKATQPDELGPAFEYVLDTISLHPDSGTLWKQYIDWLGAQPAANEWEETFRRDKVRKAYKRAVTLPLANIEALWRSYGQFETRISRVSARKFIDERSAAYMKARSAFRTYQTITKGMVFSTMPSAGDAASSAAQWLELVEWERTNPMELESEAVAARVHFTYRRAVTCARWAPRLWFDAGVKNGHAFLEQGAVAMPESYLLALKLAEFYESKNEYANVSTVLRRLVLHLQGLGVDSTPGWAELVRSTHRMQGVDGAREVVHACLTQLPMATFELYVAAAEIERAAGNEELEAQVWRFAYAKFDQDPAFVLQYLTYLFRQGDVANARSVFEQAAPRADKNLWEQMLSLERTHASESATSLHALQSLEARFAQQFPGTDTVDLFMRRFHNHTRLFETVAERVATPASEASSIELDANGPITSLLNMLPPANVYDGPLINTALLTQLIQSA